MISMPHPLTIAVGSTVWGILRHLWTLLLMNTSADGE